MWRAVGLPPAAAARTAGKWNGDCSWSSHKSRTKKAARRAGSCPCPRPCLFPGREGPRLREGRQGTDRRRSCIVAGVHHSTGRTLGNAMLRQSSRDHAATKGPLGIHGSAASRVALSQNCYGKKGESKKENARSPRSQNKHPTRKPKKERKQNPRRNPKRSLPN